MTPNISYSARIANYGIDFSPLSPREILDLSPETQIKISSYDAASAGVTTRETTVREILTNLVV